MNSTFLRAVSLLFVTLVLTACGPAGRTADKPSAVQVVAAENIYGDLCQQIGGVHVNVVSVLSDPNVDPHEYESNVETAKQIADADVVVANGGGYDDWIDKIMATSPGSKRVALHAFDLAPVKLKDNEHVWYNPDNVVVIAQAIADALKLKDPANGADYDSNLAVLKTEISKLNAQLLQLKGKYSGTPIVLTETIFLYQSELIGLNVLTPWTFDKAIAEGNDPSPADAVLAESQLTSKKGKVLVYNVQTITPITTKLETEAKALGIPVVAVSETMPPGAHYQSWMAKQLDALGEALARSK